LLLALEVKLQIKYHSQFIPMPALLLIQLLMVHLWIWLSTLSTPRH